MSKATALNTQSPNTYTWRGSSRNQNLRHTFCGEDILKLKGKCKTLLFKHTHTTLNQTQINNIHFNNKKQKKQIITTTTKTKLHTFQKQQQHKVQTLILHKQYV